MQETKDKILSLPNLAGGTSPQFNPVAQVLRLGNGSAAHFQKKKAMQIKALLKRDI